jgi:signal transduction histidine kinase
VELRVEDDGPGIPAEALPCIFEAFFTTKPVGEGTGLGLSIVHEIVTRHGGKVWVASRESRTGTTMVVALPQMRSATAEKS